MAAASTVALVVASIIGIDQSRIARENQEQQAKAAAKAQKEQAAAQQEQIDKQDILARNEMEAGMEDESGGPRLRARPDQTRRRVRRETLTPRGLGIPMQEGVSPGMQTGYRSV